MIANLLLMILTATIFGVAGTFAAGPPGGAVGVVVGTFVGDRLAH